MKKFFLLIFAFGFLSLQAQDVNITFRVNMNETSGFTASDSVWVVMDGDEYYKFTEYYGMADDDVDGIYTYTLTVPSTGGDIVQQYSFAYGPDAANYTHWETPPDECRNANYYREVTIPSGQTDMILPAYYYGMCTDNLGGMVSVTFQIDMSDVVDLDGDVWFNLNGDWSDYYTMTDDNADHIYTVTKSYNTGDVVYYKFGYQNGPDPNVDYVDEVVPEVCGGTLGVRRFVAGTEDETVPVVKFNACPGGTTELVQATFSVDMSNEAVGGKQVWMVIKSPWYWNELSTSGDNIYSSTIKIHPGQTFPFTFLLGAQDEWSGEESVPAECNHGTPSAPERLFEGAMNDTVMTVITFGECLDISVKYEITFRVDMSEIVDLYAGGYVWVNLDNWTDWYDMTDENSDHIYEFTALHSEGEEIKYIFAYQNGENPEVNYVDETVPGDCATEGQRVFTVGTEDEVLDVIIFGSCETSGVKRYSDKHLRIYPNPVQDYINIEFPQPSTGLLSIMDLSGRVVISEVFTGKQVISLSASNLASEIYIIRVVTETDNYQNKLIVK